MSRGGPVAALHRRARDRLSSAPGALAAQARGRCGDVLQVRNARRLDGHDSSSLRSISISSRSRASSSSLLSSAVRLRNAAVTGARNRASFRAASIRARSSARSRTGRAQRLVHLRERARHVGGGPRRPSGGASAARGAPRRAGRRARRSPRDPLRPRGSGRRGRRGTSLRSRRGPRRRRSARSRGGDLRASVSSVGRRRSLQCPRFRPQSKLCAISVAGGARTFKRAL